MPHDKYGNLLQPGDSVVLTGTIKEITSAEETYCNILFVADEAMAPDAAPYELCLSARQVQKCLEVTSPESLPGYSTGTGDAVTTTTDPPDTVTGNGPEPQL